MDIKTERGQVRTVAARWRSVYGHGAWRKDSPKQLIQSKLDALDTEASTGADVAAIIGNGSWVELPECHECGAKTWQRQSLDSRPTMRAPRLPCALIA